MSKVPKICMNCFNWHPMTVITCGKCNGSGLIEAVAKPKRKKGKGVSARSIRKKLGWKELTESEKDRNRRTP